MIAVRSARKRKIRRVVNDLFKEDNDDENSSR